MDKERQRDALLEYVKSQQQKQVKTKQQELYNQQSYSNILVIFFLFNYTCFFIHVYNPLKDELYVCNKTWIYIQVLRILFSRFFQLFEYGF